MKKKEENKEKENKIESDNKIVRKQKKNLQQIKIYQILIY